MFLLKNEIIIPRIAVIVLSLALVLLSIGGARCETSVTNGSVNDVPSRTPTPGTPSYSTTELVPSSSLSPDPGTTSSSGSKPVNNNTGAQTEESGIPLWLIILIGLIALLLIVGCLAFYLWPTEKKRAKRMIAQRSSALTTRPSSTRRTVISQTYAASSPSMASTPRSTIQTHQSSRRMSLGTRSKSPIQPATLKLPSAVPQSSMKSQVPYSTMKSPSTPSSIKSPSSTSAMKSPAPQSSMKFPKPQSSVKTPGTQSTVKSPFRSSPSRMGSSMKRTVSNPRMQTSKIQRSPSASRSRSTSSMMKPTRSSSNKPAK